MFYVWLLLSRLKAACDDPGVNLIQIFPKSSRTTCPVHINTRDMRAYADHAETSKRAYQPTAKSEGKRAFRLIEDNNNISVALRNLIDLFKDKLEHRAYSLTCF